MASKSRIVNLAGLDIICNRILTGKDKVSGGSTPIADTVTPGAVLGGRRNIVSHTTGATRTLTVDESGSLYLLNKADGVIITLPAASVANIGVWYEFFAKTAVTSNAYKWSTATQNTEFFDGTFVGMDEDGVVTSGQVFTGDGTTHDNISMNGTTTGGRQGTQFRLTCTALNKWTVTGLFGGNGTIATPFATS